MVYIWYDDRTGPKFYSVPSPSTMYDLKVKVMDLELLCLRLSF